MQQFFSRISALLQHPEVRRKVLITGLIFLVYRLLAHVPLPAVDLASLRTLLNNSQLLSFINIVSGGTLRNFSIVAVGISPYITASIVVQLGGMVFPQLKELQKEGESGQQKLNQYTRLLTVPLAVLQSISVLALINSQGLLQSTDPLMLVTLLTTLVAGAMISLWLGELITEFGIGNGVSMVLLAGIVSQFPTAVAQLMASGSQLDLTTIAAFGVVFLGVIAAVVFMQEAIRKVPIQYARRVRGSREYGGQTTHLPIKVNVAGVMPIIFAVSLLLLPPFVSGILTGSGNTELVMWGQRLAIWFSPTSPVYMTVYFLMVCLFTFFSALVFFNTQDISDELRKSGAFVPGIRPGGPTKQYLEFVVSRISVAGAVFLGLIAILPAVAQNMTGISSLAVGGTSVLIVVSVIIETAKQADSLVVGQQYDKYL